MQNHTTTTTTTAAATAADFLPPPPVTTTATTTTTTTTTAAAAVNVVGTRGHVWCFYREVVRVLSTTHLTVCYYLRALRRPASSDL